MNAAFRGIVGFGLLWTASAGAQPPDRGSPWTFHPTATVASRCPDTPAACEAWLAFRSAHPFPYQTFAMRAGSDGTATIVISEPPPGLSRAEIDDLVRTAFGESFVKLSRFGWGTGVDGWLEDIVVTISLPVDSEKATIISGDGWDEWEVPELVLDPVRAIYSAFHGTAEGLWIDRIDEGPRTAPPPRIPAIGVRAAELRNWLATSPLWRRLGDDAGPAVAWSAVQRTSGAFRSSDGSMVAFVIPARSAVSGMRADFRRFAVESDLVVGALRSGQQSMVLLARPRQIPLADLPPLRFETLEALASARGDELGQSYERQRLFAGKILTGERAGWDWAPIYLSAELEDSEFGTLLNLADQMLKSWSEAGRIAYYDFTYPTPSSYPFDRGASQFFEDRVHSTGLVYNWNTNGFSLLTEHGNQRVLAAESSGALPVLYIPSRLSGLLSVSATDPAVEEGVDRAYRYFDGLGDPVLTRVTQNVLLYQAVNNLLPAASAGRGKQPSPTRSKATLDRLRTEAADWLRQIRDPNFRPGDAAASEIRGSVGRLLEQPGMTIDRAADLLATSQLSTLELSRLAAQEKGLLARVRAAEEASASREEDANKAFADYCALSIKFGGKKTTVGASERCSGEYTPDQQVQLNRLKAIFTDISQDAERMRSAAVQARSALRQNQTKQAETERQLVATAQLGERIAKAAWFSADLADIHTRIVDAAGRDVTSGSIRTPTIVLSCDRIGTDCAGGAIGGHNIGGKPARVTFSSGGSVRGTDSSGQTFVVPKLKAEQATPRAIESGTFAGSPPRPIETAMAASPTRPRSVLDLLNRRSASPSDFSAQLARFAECRCDVLVERVGPDSFVLVSPPPAGGKAQFVRGRAGVIDRLAGASRRDIVHIANLESRSAEALALAAQVKSAAQAPAGRLSRALSLFGGRGRRGSNSGVLLDMPPRDPALLAAGRRIRLRLASQDGAAVVKLVQQSPPWTAATVRAAEAEPLRWIAARPGLVPPSESPSVVVVAFPPGRQGQLKSFATIVEVPQQQAAATGERLRAIVQQQVSAAPAASTVRDVAAATYERIKTELNPIDIQFWLDGVGDQLARGRAPAGPIVLLGK